MLAEDNMTGLLTAKTVAILHHIFKYIFVTDFGLLIMKADFVACFVKTDIGHDSGYDHVVFQLSDLF